MTQETVTTTQTQTEETQNPVESETTVEEKEESTLLGPEEETASPEKKEDSKELEKVAVPEKYEFKLPEGMTLDEGTLDVFSPIFKELGISNEGAQRLVNAYIPLIQSTVDKQKQEAQKDYQAIVEGWKADTMKELGSESKEALAACGKALNKFGSKELRELMQETGVGNHKEMVKFMVKIGKTISEDALVEPKNQAGIPADDPRKMYSSMNQ
jgi:hypothetical protein